MTVTINYSLDGILTKNLFIESEKRDCINPDQLKKIFKYLNQNKDSVVFINNNQPGNKYINDRLCFENYDDRENNILTVRQYKDNFFNYDKEVKKSFSDCKKYYLKLLNQEEATQ